MRTFSLLNLTLWSFVITCQLMLKGNAGRHDYNEDPNPSVAPQGHENLKVNHVVNEISNSSNAECKSSADSSTSHQVCLTPGCTKAATEILSNINESVDPCEDFPRFACGGWIDRHSIPNDQDIIDIQSVVGYQIMRKIKVLLEKKLTESEPEHVRIIKDMYHSCMDIEAIRASGLRPLEEFFEVLGRWPVLDGRSWKTKYLDWYDLLALARKQGYGDHDFFIRNIVYEESNGLIIFLEMTDRVHKYGLQEPTAYVAYLEKMVEMAVKLGREDVFARKEMRDVIDFEISLGNFTFPENSSTTDISFEQLEKLAPQINWRKYFEKYLLGYPIPRNSTITVHVPYLIHFANVMQAVMLTKERVLNNYILWRIAEQHNAMFPEVQKVGRWKYCLKILKSSFGDAVDSLYAKNYFDEKIKERIQNLITIQQSDMLDVLENNEWLDQDSKKHVMDKVNALESVIGYPDKILNDTEISNKYKEIGITNGSFIDNCMKLRKLKIKEDIFKKYRKSSRFSVGHEGRHLPKNTIKLEPEFLHAPIFTKESPQYISFGSVGFQVGHAIQVGIIPSYKFPKNYSLVDKNGDLMESEEKRKCFKEQYQNYTLEDRFEVINYEARENLIRNKADGENLVRFVADRENLIRKIADSEGLKIAYKAYNTWVTKYGAEAQLPGLKYTPKQLFWISFASSLCAKSRPGYNERLGDHVFSPWEYRVAGSIANQPDFANDFQCSEGSNMNPKTKCQLW